MICKTNLPNLVAAAQPGYLIESIDLGDNTQEMRIVGDDILASATAVESDVASGKTFFAGTSDIKTGTRTNIDSSTIFDGATTILAYKSMSENRFDYTSAGYNLTIDGLSGVATIINNGTKSVGIIVDVTSSTSTAISFTITCTKESEEIVYDSKVFYYGTELGAGNCLAVAETLAGSPKAIGYTFIESATLPVFNLGSGLWNNIYSYQIVAFILGRYVGTSIGSNFLTGCSAFNQPLDLGNIISIGDRFLYGCNSFNRPLTIPSSITSISNYFIYYCSAFIHIIYNASVYPTDDYSLSQGIDTKTSVNGTGILVTGTHAADLKAALPDRTTSPYRKLVLE